MYNGHMNGATTLREPESLEVPLCSDDIPASQLILFVLYHQTQSVPSPPSLDLIVRTRRICDLYDLSRSLTPWIKDWPRQHSILKLDAVETGLYMLAAEGYCEYLSQDIHHHALSTLTPDSSEQWQTHELLCGSEAQAILGK
jgi:hypothetical protein